MTPAPASLSRCREWHSAMRQPIMAEAIEVMALWQSRLLTGGVEIHDRPIWQAIR